MGLSPMTGGGRPGPRLFAAGGWRWGELEPENGAGGGCPGTELEPCHRWGLPRNRSEPHGGWGLPRIGAFSPRGGVPAGALAPYSWKAGRHPSFFRVHREGHYYLVSLSASCLTPPNTPPGPGPASLPATQRRLLQLHLAGGLEDQQGACKYGTFCPF